MEPKKRSKWLRRIIYALVGLVIVAFLATRIFAPPKEPEYITEQATTGDIIQTVDITGSVEPASRYELQFGQSGTIQNIYVNAGDTVKAGETLAALDNGNLILQLEAQKAGLRFAQANLAKVLAGPKSQEMNINRLKVDLANVDLSAATQSQRNLLNIAANNLEFTALTVNQAQANYEQAQDTLEYAQNNSSLQDDYSDLGVDKNQILYEQINHDVEYNQNNVEQSIDQTKEAMILGFHSFNQAFSSALNNINLIIGAEADSILGPAYEDLDQQKLASARDLYFQTQNLYENFQDNAEDLTEHSNNGRFENAFNQAKNLYNNATTLTTKTKALLLDVEFSNLYTQQTQTALLQQLEAAYNNIQQHYQALLQTSQNLQTLQQTSTYSNQNGNYSSDLGENNLEAAELQDQINQLSHQKAIKDARAGLETAAIGLDQAKQNYNKAFLDYSRQADDINATIQRANIGVLTAQEQLALLNSPERLEDIAPLKAQIDQAWEQVHLAEYSLAQTYLIAPASGIIAAVNAEAGENGSLGQPLITLDTDGLIIKALASEADITKLHFGDFAEIDFDALGSEQKFHGRIVFISPAETVSQGVIYYEIKIQFNPGEAIIKPGMTANLVIHANKKEDVLVIPVRAVQYEEDQAYVEVLVTKDNQKTVEKRNVTTGLEGDQTIEIRSGLKEGEEIITFKEQQPNP